VSDTVDVVSVETADEMAAAAWKSAAEADVAVMAAAVADFKPEDSAESKLRRASGPPEVVLVPTPDILAGVAALDEPPFLVGFAAETGSADGAVEKAANKGVDLLVANDVTRDDSGFGTDTNQVSIIRPDGTIDEWPVMTKRQVAARLWDLIAAERAAR
jgi:phosphopantothenoylcysteine decarboxylase/phosphopantothenate--cysteine ligase